MLTPNLLQYLSNIHGLDVRILCNQINCAAPKPMIRLQYILQAILWVVAQGLFYRSSNIRPAETRTPPPRPRRVNWIGLVDLDSFADVSVDIKLSFHKFIDNLPVTIPFSISSNTRNSCRLFRLLRRRMPARRLSKMWHAFFCNWNVKIW